MIKIFDHYFHRRTFLQMCFDLGLLVVTVVVAVLSQATHPASASPVVLMVSVLSAIGILVINMALGFYQRVHHRTLGQTRARAVLSLCLSLSLAYLIFRLSPLSLEDEKMFLLALIAAVALMLIHRIYMAHATPRAMMRQRVLVFGSGEKARLVGRTLKSSDPSVDLVGYYASPTESRGEISGR
ncbi:hypothetical protein [Rhodoferax sp.]|uniref:hypothetical protein n=1 Tax=Rhodoferax sp. TaxID=50421 RepID=UPI00345C2FDA